MNFRKKDCIMNIFLYIIIALSFIFGETTEAILFTLLLIDNKLDMYFNK